MGKKHDKAVLRAYADRLHDILQAEIDRRLAAVDQRFADQARLADKADEALNARLEGMNEFRAEISDRASRMLTRNEYTASITGEKDRADAIHQGQADRIDRLESALDRQRGRQAAYAAVAAAIGALIPILVLVITHYH